ncbi:hypothetical protein RDWZM_007813, partial [Blomia tropicalis]
MAFNLCAYNMHQLRNESGYENRWNVLTMCLAIGIDAVWKRERKIEKAQVAYQP